MPQETEKSNTNWIARALVGHRLETPLGLKFCPILELRLVPRAATELAQRFVVYREARFAHQFGPQIPRIFSI